MAKNIYLDKDTFDFVLTANKQLRFTETTTEHMAQKIETNVLVQLGEWFLNTDLGFPWLSEVLKNNPDMKKVRTLYVNYLLNIPGVSDVLSLEFENDSSIRKLTGTWVVKMDSGEIAEGVL